MSITIQADFVEYVITSIRRITSGKIYHCVSFKQGLEEVLEVKSAEDLGLCEIVEIKDGVAKSMGRTSDLKELNANAEKLARTCTKDEVYHSGISNLDTVIESMWPKLLSASGLLVKKLILGAPIIVRFHNDADGSSGAYALYKSLEEFTSGGNPVREIYNTRWFMSKGVVYSVTDSGNDRMAVNGVSSTDLPLIIITDFGTSLGSNAGIKIVENEFDIIWLDHHPIEEGFIGTALPFYINPWQFGGDSNLTAGFLTSVFSKTISRIDTKEIENASFIGDYSSYADRSAPGYDLAMLLDMVTSDVRIAVGQSRNLAPKDIDSIIKDKKRYAELLTYSRTRMSDTLGMAVKLIKKYKAEECTIYLSDFDLLRNDETRYPLPGRFSSKLLEELISKGKRHAVLLLHFGSFISIRIDGAISDKVDILGIIAELKSLHEEEIESGGGHKNAASIKLAEGYDKEGIINELITMLRSRLKK